MLEWVQEIYSKERSRRVQLHQLHCMCAPHVPSKEWVSDSDDWSWVEDMSYCLGLVARREYLRNCAYMLLARLRLDCATIKNVILPAQVACFAIRICHWFGASRVLYLVGMTTAHERPSAVQSAASHRAALTPAWQKTGLKYIYIDKLQWGRVLVPLHGTSAPLIWWMECCQSNQWTSLHSSHKMSMLGDLPTGPCWGPKFRLWGRQLGQYKRPKLVLPQ